MYKEVNKVFRYNPETGIVTNKIYRSSNAKAGQEAGCLSPEGYRQIRFKGKLYWGHRLIWMLLYGYFPEHHIDHVNGVRDDNRLVNLREVSSSCNQQNVGTLKNNTSGYRGVSFHKPTNKWKASVTFQGKQIHLGLFGTKEEAAKARSEWEEHTPSWTCNARKEGSLI